MPAYDIDHVKIVAAVKIDNYLVYFFIFNPIVILHKNVMGIAEHHILRPRIDYSSL
jgi:hypothetical protein